MQLFTSNNIYLTNRPNVFVYAKEYKHKKSSITNNSSEFSFSQNSSFKQMNTDPSNILDAKAHEPGLRYKKAVQRKAVD